MSSLSSFPTKQVEGEIPNWVELPKDITVNILKRLSTVDIVTRVCLVCPLWWNICKDPFMWRTIHMTKLDISPNDSYKICLYAIQRSCGHLEDIDIDYFANDNLLKFIADNGSHLCRLRLVDCREISDKGLIDAAKHFPLLEELDIFFSNLTKDSLEVIGLSCPLLKSLKFRLVYNGEYEWYDEVFSFIKTMPELRHLEIISDLLTNKGLLTILDRCPRLESLNFEDCNYLDFSENVWKRCRKQIKNLRLPYDPEDDFLCDDDNYNDSLSENSNDSSNFDDEDEYGLQDSECGAIRGDDKRAYFHRLLGLLPSPRENYDDSDYSDDDDP